METVFMVIALTILSAFIAIGLMSVLVLSMTISEGRRCIKCIQRALDDSVIPHSEGTIPRIQSCVEVYEKWTSRSQ